MRGQNCVDLTEFDTESANLDLEVTAADVFEDPRVTARVSAGPAHDIAGPVHSLAVRRIRVGNKPFRRKTSPLVVAASQCSARKVELSPGTDWNRMQTLVEYQCRHALDGTPDVDRSADREIAERRDDSGLGRTVPIEVGAPWGPFRQQLGSGHVTADGDDSQFRQLCRLHRPEYCGSDDRVCDLLGMKKIRQLVSTDNCRGNDHQSCTRREGDHPFEYRRVEARRTDMEETRGLFYLVATLCCVSDPTETTVSDADTLRFSRGTGCVNDICNVRTVNRSDSVLVRDRR
ncbi:hypothetical protein RERY_66430 [Rhodococcus erythropolis]|nr:hypothetical protein RERY_66430 [Rhodococcus erythropolis]